MKNAAIARVFYDIADLLELKGENVFKVRAYQKAARAIELLPTEAEQLFKEGKLREVPGIGESIESKISELLSSSKLEYYDQLKAEFPPGISALLEIPGVGPKRAMLLTSELGIKTVDELEKAIQDGRVASLFRMGDKTAENLLHAIQALRRKDQRIPIGEALPMVDAIFSELNTVAGVRNLVPAGSLRRFRETVGDIDLMGTADQPEKVIEVFVRLPQIKEVLAQGTTKASVIVSGGLQVDLRLVEHDSFGSLLQYFTGSKDHNVKLREKWSRKGLKLSEYGITDNATGKLEKFATEEGFYGRLGMQYIPPEIREARDEIEKAEQKALPGLVEQPDIKGDFHAHTDWSDGRDSIEDMALAAKERGYSFLAITDHSAGRGIARGLTAERLVQQKEEIARLGQKLGIRLFTGIEVDIRSEGNLDFPDEVLSQLDVVIASVHSAMGQEEDKMTRRVIAAMKNPHVDIIAHPTCRLLGEREPVAIDVEAIFKAAVETGTALEINAMPSRLDLKDIHIFRARELGVKLVMDTDAHSVAHLDFMRFGVGIARRGWCEAQHILNTRPLPEIEAFLRRKNVNVGATKGKGRQSV